MKQSVQHYDCPIAVEAEAPALRRRRWLALLIVLSATFMALMDVFIANLALPALRNELKATPTEIEWVLLSYSLAYGALLILGGRAGDRFGRERVFLIGMAAFSIGSLCCGLAPTIEILIAARAVQGMGAAMMVPQVFATIQVMFATDERPQALAIYGVTVGLASISGQILGGFLMGDALNGATWRNLFFLNAPIGVAALIAGARYLPHIAAHKPRGFDFQGGALLQLVLMLLLFPLADFANGAGSYADAAALAAAPLTLMLFIHHEAALCYRGGDPLVDQRLFADRRFSAGSGIVWSVQSALAGFLFTYCVFQLRDARLSPADVCLALAMPGLGYSAASLLAPRVIAVHGRRSLVMSTSLCVAGYFALGLLAISDSSSSPHVALMHSTGPMLVIGAATGLIFTPAINVATSRLPPALAGLAGGVVPTAIQLGNLAGVAVIGSLYFRLLEDGMRYEYAFAVSCAAMAAFAGLSLPLISRIDDLRGDSRSELS